jgi:ADP-ribosylglycohydrolase
VPATFEQRSGRSLASLEGLSVGDALGERFFGEAGEARRRIRARELPAPSWRWTDDTLMAVSVVEVLLERGRIDQAELFANFVRRYDMGRGYGPATHILLQEGARGRADHRSASRQFNGSGSFGNGAAMRAAPLGAWYADDLAEAIRAAEHAALPTHTHPEGCAGSIAVAVAAAIAWQQRDQTPSPEAFLREVASHLPACEVRERIELAASLPAGSASEEAAALLGNGEQVSAQDTVPFALWAAAGSLDDFAETFWRTVAGLGDRDTTCAIACGVIASRLGLDAIPRAWRKAREPIPALRPRQPTKRAIWWRLR